MLASGRNVTGSGSGIYDKGYLLHYKILFFGCYYNQSRILLEFL
jgi:hypothetical protein